MALKAPDCDTFPLCQKHHREFHDASGFFRGWTKQERRAWQDEAVVTTTADYLLNDDPEAF